MLHKTAFYIFIAIIFSTSHGFSQTIEELPSRLSLEEAIAYALENSYKAIDSRKEVAKALKQKWETTDRKSTRLNSSHVAISYAVFCLKKKRKIVNKVIDKPIIRSEVT